MSRFARYEPSVSRRERLQVACELLTPAALDSVARLFASRERVSLERARQTWSGRLGRQSADGSVVTFVATTAAGAVVGYGALEDVVVDGGECPSGWYLAGLVVDAPSRRRGVGARLVSARLSWLAERDVRVSHHLANDHNRASIALHARFGFTEVARGVAMPGVRFEGGAGILFSRSSALTA